MPVGPVMRPRRDAVRRRSWLLATLLILLMVLPAGPAQAHDVLLRSVPAQGTALAAGPDRVQLIFAEPVDSRYAIVRVFGPDGRVVSTGSVSATGTTLTQLLGTQRPPGAYRLSYRVVSLDGHPVTGSTTFTVQPPGGSATASVPVVAPVSGAAAVRTSGGGVPRAELGAVAVLAVACLVAAVTRGARSAREARRPSSSAPEGSR